MSLIHNERLRLTASWLNTLAAGIIVTGVVAPVVAALYGVHQVSVRGTLIAALAVAWFVVGIALHLLARWLLTKLRP